MKSSNCILKTHCHSSRVAMLRGMIVLPNVNVIHLWQGHSAKRKGDAPRELALNDVSAGEPLT